jgi:hypothetical protein
MFYWEETLFSLSNEHDHEATQAQPKHVDSLILSSPGRYTINLARTPIAASHQAIEHQILEEMGLDDLEVDPQTQSVPEG